MIVAWIYDGLGNQLFQYAFARKQAWQQGTQLKLDISSYEKRTYRKFELNRFNIVASIATNDEINIAKKNGVISEKSANQYEDNIQVHKDVYIKGYWQSWRYLTSIEDMLRCELKPKQISPIAQEWHEKIKKSTYSVSLHIRRGDYIGDPLVTRTYGILSLRYYQDCLEIIKKNIPSFEVYVFSDDILWAKENLTITEPTYYVEGTDAIDDLYLISRCSAHILSNSTFSWWGAWLDESPNKIVCIPDPWFRIPVYNTDLLPPEWIRVSVDYSQAVDLSINRNFLALIIVIHNQKMKIESYVNKLLDQTFTGYKVYIIDDASTDGSFELCQKLYGEKKFIKIIRNPRYMGKNISRNIGTIKCNEKYVMFLDLEDALISNQALEGMHRSAMVTDSDIIQTGAYWFPDNIHNNVNGQINLSAHINNNNLNEDVFVNNDISSKLCAFDDKRLTWFIGDKLYRRDYLVNNHIAFRNADNLYNDYLFVFATVIQANKIVVMAPLYGGAVRQIYYFPNFAKDNYKRIYIEKNTIAVLISQIFSEVYSFILDIKRTNLNDNEFVKINSFILTNMNNFILTLKDIKDRNNASRLPQWINAWL